MHIYNHRWRSHLIIFINQILHKDTLLVRSMLSFTRDSRALYYKATTDGMQYIDQHISNGSLLSESKNPES
jgi:hypothetical protein